MILLVSCIVIFVAFLNLYPYEEEDIEIVSYVQEQYVNVAPGGSINTSVYIGNDGNTDVDVRLRFNHEYKWNLTVDDRVGPYLDRQSEGIIRIRAGSPGDNTTRIDFLHTSPRSVEIGHRWMFIVDVIHIDEDLVQHMETHHFIITVGWVLVPFIGSIAPLDGPTTTLETYVKLVPATERTPSPTPREHI